MTRLTAECDGDTVGCKNEKEDCGEKIGQRMCDDYEDT